jgi:hypothetical protein
MPSSNDMLRKVNVSSSSRGMGTRKEYRILMEKFEKRKEVNIKIDLRRVFGGE